MSARALVTGATGLVGSHIVDRLVADGWSVRALVRSSAAQHAFAERGVEAASGDVLDLDSFGRAARDVEVIFHTAAAITPRGGWEAFGTLNIGGARNAVAAAEASRARLVQMSSVAVYGPERRSARTGRKTDEDTPLAALPTRAHYARSKRESEQLVLDAHRAGRIWATAVRPVVVYGPRDRQFVPRIARLLRRGVAPLIGGGRSIIPVVHAANVADGALRAATHDVAGGRPYLLANDYEVTVAEFFTLAAEGLGRRIRFVRIPHRVARVLFRGLNVIARFAAGGRLGAVSDASLGFLTHDNPFTSDRARRELGWAPAVHPKQGVPEAFRWWLTHH